MKHGGELIKCGAKNYNVSTHTHTHTEPHSFVFDPNAQSQTLAKIEAAIILYYKYH